MRRRPLACLLLALGAALAGCAAPLQAEVTPPPKETPLPTPTPAAQLEPFVLPCYAGAGFHPITGSNRTNLSLAGLMYEGLFAVTPAFEAEEVLCTAHTRSEDGLTWTFALDSAARFSDGTALTAADAAYSLELARRSALYAARLEGIAAVAAGEGTVTVTLTAPNGALPLLLDIPVVRESGDPGRPLGTGPYALEGTEESLVLRRWRGTAPLEEIPLLTVAEAGDLIHAFETREVSFVTTDFSGTNALGFSGSFETQDFSTSNLLYVGFNAQEGLCEEEGLRLALQRAFDRDTVAAVLLARQAQAAALPVSPDSALYSEVLAEPLAHSPREAADLLAELGWTAGEDGALARGREVLALDLLVSSDNTGRLAIAEALAADLTELGIQVNLRKLPWESYLAALEGGDFDLYLGETRMTADFDPTPFLAEEGALNYGGYRDETADALLAAFRAASGDARRTAGRLLYAYLAEHPAFVPLCFKRWSALTQWGQTEGITPTQQNVFYGFADWEIKR